jgi:hypothetical protein
LKALYFLAVERHAEDDVAEDLAFQRSPRLD